MKNQIAAYFRKSHKQIWGSLLLAVTVFFSAPLSVFLINQNTLEFTFKDALPIYLGYTLLAFVSLAAISIAVKIFWRYLVVIYVALSLGFVIQGNYLLYDLGKMDGHIIEWSTFYRFIPIELLVWVGLITAAVIFRKKIYKNFMFAAGLVFVLSIFPIFGYFVTQGLPSKQETEKQYVDYSKQFEFSDDKNVVVIVLDTFRSDAFEELLYTDSQYAEAFKDFTFFTNAAAGYPTTKPSIPLILTGKYYDNSKPAKDFIAENTKNSLPNLLHNNEVEIEGYFITPPFPAPWRNLTRKISKDALTVIVTKQLFATYLRYTPLLTKPFFLEKFYSGEEYFHKDILDLYTNSESTRLVASRPIFKFIHLTGPHPPFQLDSSFNRVDQGYLEQAKASLNAVVKLLEEMKAADAYDSSLILVLGDHGTNHPISLNFASQQYTGETDIIMPHRLNSWAEPLMLAKNFNQQSDIITHSSAPVSVADIPKTVTQALGLENDFEGYSIFQEIPQNRTRKFYFYWWDKLDWNKDFLPTMYEYEIQGDISDISSWEFLNKIYTEDGVASISYPLYKFGSDMVQTIITSKFDVSFAPGFQITSDPKKGVWSISSLACIYFQTEVSSRALSLEIQGQPFLSPGKLDRQRMVIIMDQEEVGVVDAAKNLHITIPPKAVEKYTSDNKVQLCFSFPDAQSSKQLEISEDRRLLGYRFFSLSLAESKPLSLPLELQFTKNQTSTVAQLSGFASPEENFTWTNGQSASIYLPVPETEKDLVFEFLAKPFLAQGKLHNQKVTIRVNGQLIRQLTIRQEQEFSFTIPAEAIADGLKIEFELPDAASPFEYEMSGDKRQLGLAFKWIKIREK